MNLKDNFFGDGSIVIFSFGVLASFLSVSVLNIKDFKFEIGQNNFINNRSLLLAFQVLFYIVSYKIFEKAQTNFDRSWEFIYLINISSFVLLVLAYLIVLFLQFERRYDWSIIHPYMEEIRARKQAKKAKGKNKSGDIKL